MRAVLMRDGVALVKRMHAVHTLDNGEIRLEIWRIHPQAELPCRDGTTPRAAASVVSKGM